MLDNVHSLEIYGLLYGLVYTYDQTWSVGTVRGRTMIDAAAPAPVLVTTVPQQNASISTRKKGKTHSMWDEWCHVSAMGVHIHSESDSLTLRNVTDTSANTDTKVHFQVKRSPAPISQTIRDEGAKYFMHKLCDRAVTINFTSRGEPQFPP